MRCEIHDIDMEWVEATGHPEGGYWWCASCQEDEEADFAGEEGGTGPEFGPWSLPEEDDDPSRFCLHCGKEYEDFSDYGCEYCDRRVL